MSSINRKLLAIKLKEQQDLNEEIAALRIAARIEEAITVTVDNEIVSSAKPSGKKEKEEQRTKKVIELLKAAKDGMGARELGTHFGLHENSMRDWMVGQIKKHGELCQWETGHSTFHFKLKA